MFKLIRFLESGNRYRIGLCYAQYHDLIMELEVVYYAPEHKIWIRMPEKWVTKTNKKSYCRWNSRKISDSFQEKIITQLDTIYSMNADKAKALYEQAKKEGKEKARLNSNKKLR